MWNIWECWNSLQTKLCKWGNEWSCEEKLSLSSDAFSGIYQIQIIFELKSSKEELFLYRTKMAFQCCDSKMQKQKEICTSYLNSGFTRCQIMRKLCAYGWFAHSSVRIILLLLSTLCCYIYRCNIHIYLFSDVEETEPKSN